MDTKSLQLFKAVYEAGSITKAAKRMYLSQQGLSKAVARLEEEMDCRLFDRVSGGVVPTPHGRALYRKTAQLVDLLDSIKREVESGERRTLLVGATAGMVLYTGIKFRNDFETEHPDIALEVDECTDLRISDMLLKGEIDVGLMAGPVNPALFNALPFSRHRHVLVVAPNDPLASRDTVDFSDLDSRTVALFAREYAPYQNSLRCLSKANAKPKRLIEVAEGYTGLQLAATGEAVCISTDYAAAAAAPTSCRVIPFSDPDISWDVYLTTVRGRTIAPDATAFLQFAQRWIDRNRLGLYTWEHSVF